MSWIDDLLAAIRIAGSAAPLVAPLLQLDAEVDRRGLAKRLEALEDPISRLHPDVAEVSKRLYEEVRRTEGDSAMLHPGPEFFDRYGKALAILESHGLVTGTHTLARRFHSGVRAAAPYVLYMAARYEDERRLAAAQARIESAPRGSWLDGRELATELGVPWILLAALFDIYEAKGLGVRSKQIGTVNYRATV
jgi:hypothetical protein